MLASGVLGVSYQLGSALGLAVMTSIATSYGADQLGNVASLTNGFQAAFIATAAVALTGALVALFTLRGRKSGGAALREQLDVEHEAAEAEREPVAA